ncbi:MAG: DNA polymerase III subunit chi, partial [Betaproteobacteria bacterium]|nr:DNA polymerase III subunit chi [Betaproteobacteria bacterium]
MTEIKFFFNVDDKLSFACKWVKKAYEDGRKLIVYTPDGRTADSFDRRLWEFSQLSFVPHVKANHPLAAETPIIIANDDENLPHHEVLLNLADEPPPFF